MKINSRIYVAGHRGLVGSAIIRALKQKGFENLITRTHAELELLDAVAVKNFFAETKPEFVFLAAAKVGGIHANSTYPADFIREKNRGLGLGFSNRFRIGVFQPFSKLDWEPCHFNKVTVGRFFFDIKK